MLGGGDIFLPTRPACVQRQIVASKEPGTNIGANPLIQAGDILVEFNHHPVGNESIEGLTRLLHTTTFPYSLTFHNPFAVDKDLAVMAERPHVCTCQSRGPCELRCAMYYVVNPCVCCAQSCHPPSP